MIKTNAIIPSISRMAITVIGAISLYYANMENDSFLIGALMPMIAFGFAAFLFWDVVHSFYINGVMTRTGDGDPFTAMAYLYHERDKRYAPLFEWMGLWCIVPISLLVTLDLCAMLYSTVLLYIRLGQIITG